MDSKKYNKQIITHGTFSTFHVAAIHSQTILPTGGFTAQQKVMFLELH